MTTNVELGNFKDEVIKNAFPELMKVDIKIDFELIKDACMEIGELEDEGHYIEVDTSLMIIHDDDENEILKGGIAHELSHIIRKPKGVFNIWIEKLLYKMSSRYRELDERNTDLITILRGYGNELLKFLKYCEQDYSRYEEDGLSQIEIKALLENIGSKKHKR